MCKSSHLCVGIQIRTNYVCVQVRTRVFENKSEPMGGCGQCRTSKNVYTTQEECNYMQIKSYVLMSEHSNEDLALRHVMAYSLDRGSLNVYLQMCLITCTPIFCVKHNIHMLCFLFRFTFDELYHQFRSNRDSNSQPQHSKVNTLAFLPRSLARGKVLATA